MQKDSPVHGSKVPREQLAARKPTNAASLEQFHKEMGNALRRSIALSIPDLTRPNPVEGSDFTAQPFAIGGNNRLPALFLTPKAEAGNGSTTLIVHPQGAMNLIDSETGRPTRLVADLLAAGESVLGVDLFLTGAHSAADGKVIRDTSNRHFTTYNHTDAALRVQDILTALTYLKSQAAMSSLNLIGLGEAGLWCLLAAGFADVAHTVVDANGFDGDNDTAYLQTLPIPSIRRVGDFRTAGTLVAPHYLLIHNTGNIISDRLDRGCLPSRWCCESVTSGDGSGIRGRYRSMAYKITRVASSRHIALNPDLMPFRASSLRGIGGGTTCVSYCNATRNLG